MKIRSKLLISYGLMLMAIITIAVVSLMVRQTWRMAADGLERMRLQSALAEELRSGMNSRINYGLDFLNGITYDKAELDDADRRVEASLDSLKNVIGTADERELIESLEETKLELDWILSGILNRTDATGSFNALQSDSEINNARNRLREIASELSDDVVVLNQFYRHAVDEYFMAVSEAGKRAVLVITTGVGVTLVQLILLIILISRWLVRPMALVGQTARQISSGNFKARLDLKSSDEWSHLADQINLMAGSLTEYDHQLRIKERFAALGEVAAYTAHNIRNPLAGIRASAQVNLSQEATHSPQLAESLTDIIGEVDRLEGWVASLLDFSKPLDLHREQVVCERLIAESIKAVEAKALSQKVKIDFICDDDLPDIWVDYYLMEQVMAVIITNSIEAGAANIKIIASHHQNFKSTGDEVIMEVADDGKGISPEMKTRLFLPFVSSKSKGTGLGLAQAKKIIELHGGSLKIDESVSSGAVFKISLPAFRPNESTSNQDK